MDLFDCVSRRKKKERRNVDFHNDLHAATVVIDNLILQNENSSEFNSFEHRKRSFNRLIDSSGCYEQTKRCAHCDSRLLECDKSSHKFAKVGKSLFGFCEEECWDLWLRNGGGVAGMEPSDVAITEEEIQPEMSTTPRSHLKERLSQELHSLYMSPLFSPIYLPESTSANDVDAMSLPPSMPQGEGLRLHPSFGSGSSRSLRGSSRSLTGSSRSLTGSSRSLMGSSRSLRGSGRSLTGPNVSHTTADPRTHSHQSTLASSTTTSTKNGPLANITSQIDSESSTCSSVLSIL